MAKLSTVFQQDKNRVLVTFSADLLSTNANDVLQAILPHLDQLNAVNKLVFDLKAARMVDSVGLNMLIELANRVKQKNSSFVLQIGSQNVERVIALANMDELVTIEMRKKRNRSK